eukprot:m.117968 g.117968  ORF g.117968 m.117968 type:complete len:1260 (-) comp14500_c0_seq9:75-3854(-)
MHPQPRAASSTAHTPQFTLTIPSARMAGSANTTSSTLTSANASTITSASTPSAAAGTSTTTGTLSQQHATGHTSSHSAIAPAAGTQSLAPSALASISNIDTMRIPLRDEQYEQLQAQVAAYRSIVKNERVDALTRSRMAARSADVSDLRHPPLVPTRTAPAFTLQELRGERERHMAAARSHRMHLLAQFAAAAAVTTAPVDPATRSAVTLELKALKLLQLQYRVRQSMIQLGVVTPTPMQPRARLTAEEKRERVRRAEFLAAFLNHAKDFKEFHRAVRTKIGKIARSINGVQLAELREQQKEEERKQRERMAALRTSDETTYRRLVEEEKNERLGFLLRKTDEYVSNMRATVEQHQFRQLSVPAPAEGAGAAGPATGAAAPIAATAAASTSDAEADGNKKEPGAEVQGEESKGETMTEMEALAQNPEDSFGVGHITRERILAQPTCLVGGTLKPYQLLGLEWLVSLYNNGLNGILADEMGLGKTIQSIAFMSYLREKKNNLGPFLVVVPLGTLSNWTLEFSRWCPSLSVIVYTGSPPVRKSMHPAIKEGRFNVLLTTYEFIIRDKSVLGKPEWKVMLMDEGHRMKNRDCKLSTALGASYTITRRFLLTGTPLQNNLPELWALLNFILPDIFNSQREFDEWFSSPFVGTTETVALNEEEKLLIIQQLHKVLRPFLLRRLKKDVETQLPDKVEHVIKCRMSALQQRLYAIMKVHGVLMTESTSPDRPALRPLKNVIMQLRKLCNHPFVFDGVEASLAKHLNGTAVAEPVELWRVAGKFEALDRILTKLIAGGHRTLLFCQMTQLMTILEDFLVYKQIRFLRLDGGTSADLRQKLLESFNAPDSPHKVFLLSTRAGGLGLNLQTADTVILFDSDWNPHQDMQAQDRAHRIGQRSEVRVLRLCTVGSIEERVLEAAHRKRTVDEMVIQAGMFNQWSNSQSRRKYLESIMQEEAADAGEGEEVDGVPTPEQLNAMLSRSPEETILFQQIDEQFEKDATWRTARRKSRLMEESELPPWVMIDPELVGLLLSGEGTGQLLGARKRKAVDYGDAMTEAQFLRAAEAGTLATTRPPATSPGSTPGPAVAAAAAAAVAVAAPGGGARPASAARRGAAAATPPAKTARVELDPRRIAAIASELVEILSSHTDRLGRYLSDHFAELPDDPEYYSTVRNPIDLNTIRERAVARQYSSLDDLQTDVFRMLDNAVQYNAKALQLKEDAATLRSLFIKTRKQLEDEDDEQADMEGELDDADAGEGLGEGEGEGGW